MVTPDELRRRADALDADGLQALDAGDRARAVELFRRAGDYRAAADALSGLQAQRNAATVADMMPSPRPASPKPPAAVLRSIAAGGTGPFYDHARTRGIHSARALGAKLGVPASTITRWTSGRFSIPRSRAKEIEKLIGWPADEKHWPGGIRD